MKLDDINMLYEQISEEQSHIDEFNRRLSVLDEKKRKICTIKPTDSGNKIRKKCKVARVWGLHYAPVWDRYVGNQSNDSASEMGTDSGAEAPAAPSIGEAGFVYPLSIGAENDPRLINDELTSPEPTLKKISYIFPNTELEWKEATRYPELKDKGIDHWNEMLESGEVFSWSELESVDNYNGDLEELNPQKILNVKNRIQNGVVELPIIGKSHDNKYELISGNTRIALLTTLGYDPYVLVVDLPSAEKKRKSTPTKKKRKPTVKKKKTPTKKKPKSSSSQSKEKPKSSTERVRRYYKRHPEKVRKYLRDTQDDRVKRNGDRAKAIKKYGKKKMKNHDVHHPNGVNGGKWTLAKKDHGRDKKNESVEYVYLSELKEGLVPNGAWSLISEGGAAGHLAHPYEDNTLKFKEVKDMIQRGLVGRLDSEAPVTEKLDGQNIMFTVKNGRVHFARNKGQVKGKGKNSLDVAGIRQMFAGRGNVEKAFTTAAEDLQSAVSSLSDEQRENMFMDGEKFMNVEIIFPDNKNVIPYDKNVLVFHGTVQYDLEGNEVARNISDGESLSDELTKINAQQQKTYGLSGPRSINFSDADTVKNLKNLRQYVSDVERIQREFGLDDSATIEDYKKAWWQREIDNSGIQWTPQEQKGLINRWALGDKKFGVKNIEDPEKKKWFREFEANQLSRMQKLATRPLERMFLKLGADSLLRVTNFLSANNPGLTKELKQEVLDTIKAVEETEDENKLAKLQLEIERLEDIGINNIIPSEGIVFIYKGKPYKFTGTFAPINQILGMLKFQKGKAQDTDAEDVPVETPEEPKEKEEPSQPEPPTQEPEVEPAPEELPPERTVAIFAGRFQPFHAGHYSIYKAMVKKFGEDNVFVASSNKTDDIKSPFGFSDKKEIMTKMFDMPEDKIVQVKNPYTPVEILQKLPPNTVYVTAVSQKDAERLGGKYFKSFEDTPEEERKGYGEQGYVIIAPEMQLQINGKNISGTQIRSVLGNPNITDRAKQEIFTKIYGKFDKKLFNKIVKTATQSYDAQELTKTHGATGTKARVRMKRAEEPTTQVQTPQQVQPTGERLGQEELPSSERKKKEPETKGTRDLHQPGEVWQTGSGIYGAKNRSQKVTKYFRTQQSAVRYSQT